MTVYLIVVSARKGRGWDGDDHQGAKKNPMNTVSGMEGHSGKMEAEIPILTSQNLLWALVKKSRFLGLEQSLGIY